MNTLAIERYPLLSYKFVKAYFITMRPYLMFVSGITGIAGMSFAPDLSILNATLIFFASFFSYGFGQALTDCFQIDTDSLSSPYRPLTQGLVSRNHFLAVSSIGLFICILILTFFNPLNLMLGILAGIGLATYTYFKRRWWAGSFYNSWIVLVLFLMSYLAASGRVVIDFSNAIFSVSVITVFFGYANFVLTGYFKDIDADRKTSYKTLPVVFGRKFSAVVSDVFGSIYAIAVFVLVIALAFNTFSHQTLIKSLFFVYSGIAAIVIAQMNLHSIKTDSEAKRAIVPCVHSYILLLSSLTILNKPDWFFPLAIFYILYILTMRARPAKEQI